jgi:hypothetical protein
LGITTPVAAVDGLVGVQKKHEPRQVVIELENTQVQTGDFRESNANKLVRNLGQRALQTDNLPVDLGAVASRFASKDEKDGFSGAACLGSGRLIIGKPAVPSGVGTTNLSGSGSCGEKEESTGRQATAHAGCLDGRQEPEL